MKKKYQIFISSTFSDLINERQAAVEAILRSGHIPAGMELFSAGSETQLEIIKRWIEDSDIYMLLLGGRYGTLEPISELSYTEIEYKYAIELGKPIFSIVMSDEGLDKKLAELGKKGLELDERKKYDEFKTLVLSKISRFFTTTNDIKLSILESIIDIQNRYSLSGWVQASEVPDITKIMKQLTELNEKNKKLESQAVDTIRVDKIGEYSYEDIKNQLSKIEVIVPENILKDFKKQTTTNVLDLFLRYKNVLSVGLSNRVGASNAEIFLIREVMSHLRIYDLVEIVKIASVAHSKFQTSKLGNKFLALYSMKK